MTEPTRHQEHETETQEADLPNVCVVTHPLAAAGETPRGAADGRSAITSAALVTAVGQRFRSATGTNSSNSREGAGDSVVIAAFRFLPNQLRTCRVIAGRDEDVVLYVGATSYLLPIVVTRLLGKTVLVEPRGDVPLTLRLLGTAVADRWRLSSLGPSVPRTSRLRRGTRRHHLHARDGSPTGPHPESRAYIRQGRATSGRTNSASSDPTLTATASSGSSDGSTKNKLSENLCRCTNSSDDITIRIVADGDLREWLEEDLAADIEAGHVELTGWVDHDKVPHALNDLELLILPSQPTEGSRRLFWRRWLAERRYMPVRSQVSRTWSGTRRPASPSIRANPRHWRRVSSEILDGTICQQSASTDAPCSNASTSSRAPSAPWPKSVAGDGRHPAAEAFVDNLIQMRALDIVTSRGSISSGGHTVRIRRSRDGCPR